jgi:hypothetical protein
VDLKQHLEFESDQRGFEGKRKVPTLREDREFSKFLSNRLWKRITNFILHNKQGFEFQMKHINKILDFENITRQKLRRFGLRGSQDVATARSAAQKFLDKKGNL